jgi:hypothetical protein
MWACGYFCCSSNVTDEIIANYIEGQENDDPEETFLIPK